jgi:hypothetical protein
VAFQVLKAASINKAVALMVEAAGAFELSVNLEELTRRKDPEDGNVHLLLEVMGRIPNVTRPGTWIPRDKAQSGECSQTMDRLLWIAQVTLPGGKRKAEFNLEDLFRHKSQVSTQLTSVGPAGTNCEVKLHKQTANHTCPKKPDAE